MNEIEKRERERERVRERERWKINQLVYQIMKRKYSNEKFIKISEEKSKNKKI